MIRNLGILLAAALWSGCNEPPGTAGCSAGDSPRCYSNGLQYCGKNFLSGDYSWVTTRQCSSPQVCRVDTAGAAVVLDGEDGCFDPNAVCPSLGYKECNRALTAYGGQYVELYECIRRASDQTLQWSATNCMQLVPEHICYSTFPSAGSACVENVKNCDPNPASAYCDGTDVVSCTVTITDKAVWDWSRLSCSSMGMVCRVVAGDARCANP